MFVCTDTDILHIIEKLVGQKEYTSDSRERHFRRKISRVT